MLEAWTSENLVHEGQFWQIRLPFDASRSRPAALLGSSGTIWD